jgi:DNA-binding transcriptional ArsR family regulator
LTASLDVVFAALSDATRRSILVQLLDGEASVSELAAPHRMSLPAVMKHLGVLDAAGLVARRKEGRVCRCRLRPKAMRRASEWLGQYRPFWSNQLDSLAAFLADGER